MAWWKRAQTGPIVVDSKPRSVPAGVWAKCDACGQILVESDLEEQMYVCPSCGHHYPLAPEKRLALILDAGTFEEMAARTEPTDPLSFKDSKKYKDRLRAARKKSGFSEAVLVGSGRIEERPVMVGVMAFGYLGGSMGSVVGERITRLFEAAVEKACPAIIFSASGGARMQEGILSLMQMAKTTAALQRLRDAGQPYISVLLHPTTGGVAASFSMLGDVNIAEPGALIGFAGPRVIEQTIRETLPEGFQRSEFLLDHGMLDMIVTRQQLRPTIARVLGFLCGPIR